MSVQKKVILYSGQDKNFWYQIKDRFETNYSHHGYEFIDIYDSNPDHYQQTFLEILKIKPVIIYIDFSENMRTQKKLSLMIKRVSDLKHIPVVGVLENKEDFKGAWASKADILAVKSAEFHDLLYHPLYIKDAKSVNRPDFAKAKMDSDANLIFDLRVGYISEGIMHAEGDLNVSKGDEVELFTSIPTDCNDSKKFTVKAVEKTNHYYDFDFSYDLSLTYVDPPDYESLEIQMHEVSDDPKLVEELKEKSKTLRAEYEHKLKMTKKKQKEWVLDSMDKSLSKSTKVLVVDPHLKFLSYEKTPIDQHPFTIRIETVFDENLNCVDKIMPNIIALQVDDTTDKSKQGSIDELSKLVIKIKALADYDPFIILFQSGKISSKACQENFQYPNIIAHKEEMVLDTILKMAEIYETKKKQKEDAELDQEILTLRKQDPMKYGRLTKDDFKDKRYYIKKTSDLSYASFSKPVKIKSISESEISFLTEEELKLTNYRLDYPLDMYVRLVPIEDKPYIKEAGQLLYKGLLHGLGENDKKQLRRLVNEVFTADVSEREGEEKQQFFELNASIQAERDEKELEKLRELEALSNEEENDQVGEKTPPSEEGPES